LADATNDQGEIAVRVSIQGGAQRAQVKRLRCAVVGDGEVARQQAYFFERGDYANPADPTVQLELPPQDEDVLVLWLRGVTEASEVELRADRHRWRCSLAELSSQPERVFEAEDLRVTVNLLGHREIGYLDLKTLGVADRDRFRLAIMADPQGGDPGDNSNEDTTRIKIHNAYVEACVELTNELKPDLALVLGDFTDSQGQERNFRQMERLFAPLKAPLLLEIGNHETAYRSTFSPGYDLSAFDQYFASQRRINGTEYLLYAFNLGQWHIVVWPDPLRPNFWATHPHYFDWLARDLAAHQDRPVIFLHHVPLHPIGIDPLLAYVETPAVRRTLLDILASHGQVRYAFSGHVHIPTRASLKTAVEMRGIKMINLPATGYRARSFGEEDFYGGPEQGVCMVDVDGQDVKVRIHTVTREQFTYPDRFPAFDESAYPLWLREAWDLPLEASLQNGDFSQGLAHWHRRFVYQESEHPSNRCEVHPLPDGQSALHLYACKRRYDAPGQDRMPQTLNRICQAIAVKGDLPGLQLRYHLPEAHFHPQSYNGAYLWVAAYRGTESLAHLVYSAGKMYYNLPSQFGQAQGAPVMHFDLPTQPGQWQQVSLSPEADFQQANDGQRSLRAGKPDRLVVHLGVWTINDGYQQEIGIDIASLAVTPDQGRPSPTKPQAQFWARGIDHIAGEHRYAKSEEIYPPGTFDV
jgi:hypothetical protein